MNKNNLFILIMFSIIISSQFVSAYADPSRWQIYGNFGDNFWGGTTDPKHYRDVYVPDELFYPVENWEIDICVRDVSTALKPQNTVMFGQGAIYGVTTQVSAQKIIYAETNDSIYEVSWYVQPFQNDITYSLKFTGPNNLEKIIVKDEIASAVTGASNYYAFVSNQTFTHVYLSYSGIIESYSIVNVTT